MFCALFLFSHLVASNQVRDLADRGIQLVRNWKFLKLEIYYELHSFIHSTIMIKTLHDFKFIAVLCNKELYRHLNS